MYYFLLARWLVRSLSAYTQYLLLTTSILTSCYLRAHLLPVELIKVLHAKLVVDNNYMNCETAIEVNAIKMKRIEMISDVQCVQVDPHGMQMCMHTLLS